MKGSLFIVAAPSGAGKTSLVNALIKQDNGVALSVSHTTRAPRNGEVDGQDYYFVDRPTFDEMCEAGAFLESAIVFDNAYGTSAEAVEDQLNAGLDVILEIDWQGAQQVRATFADSVGVFILPPSKKTLEERLRGRGQDDETIIQRRMRDAENEISHYDEFDYVIINDDFDTALASLSAIIVSKRHDLAKQQAQHAQLIEELLG